jgi:hypothetical protein
MFAVEEKSLTLQYGYQFNSLFLGAQLRSIEWKYIRQRFKFLDLAGANAATVLAPKSFRGIFLEPALTYAPEIIWSPKFSLMYANFGTTSETYNDFHIPAELQYGISVSPPMPFGKLDFLLDYKGLNYEEIAAKKIHFGILYGFGSMQLSTGLDDNGASAGIFYSINLLNAGILFSTTQLPWKTSEFYSNTVYVQFGWQI